MLLFILSRISTRSVHGLCRTLFSAQDARLLAGNGNATYIKYVKSVVPLGGGGIGRELTVLH